MSLTLCLDKMIQSESSDFHVTIGDAPVIRYKGKLKRFNDYLKPTTRDEFVQFLKDIGLYEKWLPLDKEQDQIDAAMTYKGRRFRVHFYKTITDWAIAFRLLQESIPNIRNLNLPESSLNLVNTDSGLILVTGATGSGKTTTLAGFINEINHTQSKHIVTVEDPVEYVFKSDKCLINQREVGGNVQSFEQATIDAMREDPDIIVLGEMRDRETIQNALILAETGHLVFATLHSKSVVEAINRVVDVFPAEQQVQIRIQFASVCKAVLHQRLLTGKTSRVPLCELLVTNDVSRKMLQDSRSVNEIRDFMRSDSSGSQHLADNAAWHMAYGRLTKEDLKYILSEDDMRLAIARAGGTRG